MTLIEQIDALSAQLLEREFDKPFRQIANSAVKEIFKSLVQGVRPISANADRVTYAVSSLIGDDTYYSTGGAALNAIGSQSSAKDIEDSFKGLKLSFVPEGGGAHYIPGGDEIIVKVGYADPNVSFLDFASDSKRLGNFLRGLARFDRYLFHELIHHLDYVRTHGWVFSQITSRYGEQGADYYNDPSELNAYFQMGAKELEANTRSHFDVFWGATVRPEDMDSIVLVPPNQSELARSMSVFDRKWLKHLTPANKKRINKRIYDTIVSAQQDIRKDLANRMKFGLDRLIARKDPDGWERYFKRYGIQMKVDRKLSDQ